MALSTTRYAGPSVRYTSVTRHSKAPGEAEAELAYLNRLGVIDAVLSDDVDNFLFGATLVMRKCVPNLG